MYEPKDKLNYAQRAKMEEGFNDENAQEFTNEKGMTEINYSDGSSRVFGGMCEMSFDENGEEC